MEEPLKVRNSDFIQKILKLDGNNWRFNDRPYIYPIINNKAKRTLLLAARQTEKSTTMSGNEISTACLNPNTNLLYVSPTMKQTNVYSRKKIDEVFEVSPLLRRVFYPGVKGFRVEEKRLKNYTTMYFRSAYHDADSIRGITADNQYHDEIQDMLEEIGPIIEACSQKRKNAKFMYAGTPKTYDNNIHQKWELSSQSEWCVKCLHCGHWNILSINNVLLGKPGVWCEKCHGDIHTRYGCWVRGKDVDIEANEIEGFRLPYIILPTQDLDFPELFWKMKNYTTAALMNEVFGVSYDSGSKPLTREQLISVCNPNSVMWYEVPPSFKGNIFIAGIDWGGGDSGFTILTIGYFDAIRQKFVIVFAKRYVGKEAEPEACTQDIASICIRFNAKIVGADWGFGNGGMNSMLKRLLPSDFTFATFRHSVIKKFLAYDEQGETYVTNRTEVMTDLFNKIKTHMLEFYKWEDFEYIGKDYLNINAEYSDTLRQIRYIHSQPDDAFHSLLYAILCWMIINQQTPTTRYEPGVDDLDVHMFKND